MTKISTKKDTDVTYHELLTSDMNINAVEMTTSHFSAQEIELMAKLQQKIFAACSHELNKNLELCGDLNRLIFAGKKTRLGQYNAEKYFKTHGFLANNVSLTGSPLQRPKYLFINPQSEEYCVQSLYRDLLIPPPRPVHGYPQYDIWELLKYRMIDNKTPLCTVDFPAYFGPSDVAYRLGNLLVPQNKSHPLSTVYHTLDLLAKNAGLTLAQAGEVIANVTFHNQSSEHKAVIDTTLAGIDPMYVQIGIEPMRLRHADDIKNVSTAEKLWGLAKLSYSELRLIKDVLTLKVTANYGALSYPNESSFEFFDENMLKTLRFMMKTLTADITTVLHFFNERTEYPYVPSASDCLGENAKLEDCQPLNLKMQVEKNLTSSSLTFYLNNQFSFGYAHPVTTVKLHNDLQSRQDVELHIYCEDAQLVLGNKKINLGMVERPTVRMLYEGRVRQFISAHLTKSITENPTNLLTTNKTVIDPLNGITLLLGAEHIGAKFALNIKDYCPQFSPLSPGFVPFDKLHISDYSFGSTRSLSNVHTILFSQFCDTPARAIMMLAGFAHFNIHYLGMPNVFKNCGKLVNQTDLHHKIHAMLPVYQHDDKENVYLMALPLIAAVSMLLALMVVACQKRLRKSTYFTVKNATPKSVGENRSHFFNPKSAEQNSPLHTNVTKRPTHHRAL